MNDNKEMVNHPAHYNNGKIECIVAMRLEFSDEEVAAFCKLNAFKYLWRKDDKGLPEQDKKKAEWYTDYFNKIMFEETGLPFSYSLEDIQRKVDKYK